MRTTFIPGVIRSPWLLPLWFVLIFAAAYATKYFSSNRNDVKFKQAEQLLVLIPIYPNSELVNTSGASKDRIATIGKSYRTSASYVELKNYYLVKLQGLDWRYEGEKELLGGHRFSFRKAEFELNIEYLGEGRSGGWDYAINVTWIA